MVVAGRDRTGRISTRVAELQSCRVAELQSCRVTELQSYRVAKLLSCEALAPLAKPRGYIVTKLQRDRVTMVVPVVTGQEESPQEGQELQSYRVAKLLSCEAFAPLSKPRGYIFTKLLSGKVTMVVAGRDRTGRISTRGARVTELQSYRVAKLLSCEALAP